MGRLEHGRYTGNIVFHVQLQGKVYNPVNGTRITGKIDKKNKMGLYIIYNDAIRILIPRDLHIGNIYIHSTSDKIKNVYLLDFGYSMIKDTGSHSSSPYWLEYKNGVDCAILLWSLHRIQVFRENASPKVLEWISRKLILADGFDLKNLDTSANLYQKIDALSLEELAPLRTETISREFFFL
jgi:hypothetical protein